MTDNSYEHSKSVHFYRMSHDPSYALREKMETELIENQPSLASMFWKPPQPEEAPEISPDVDRDAYSRIRDLENNINQLRLTIVSIYKSLNEDNNINTKVQAFREKSTVEEIQKKKIEDMIARAKAGG